MKRLFVLVAVAIVCVAGSAARAQDHVEIGAFGDYFRFDATHANFVGLGGRLGVNVTRHVQFEAEMAYDFNQAFTEGFTNTNGGAVTFQQSNLKVLHGLFGPKISTRGPVRVFLTVKGGFENFRFDPTPASFSTFTSSVSSLRSSDVTGVVYPGIGMEGFLGPIGLRLDVGDEIYFVHGARNNLRVSFGPTIRF